MKILKLGLQSQKIKELKHFYGDILGFALKTAAKDRFSLQAGASELIFEQSDSAATAAPFYHFAFNIPHNLLQEALLWLEAKGLNLLEFKGSTLIDFPNWHAKAIYFLDPAHNIVEFIARNDLDNRREGPFGVEMITEISEIGLPVPAVKEAYETLHTTFGIPVYSHISNMETFCAAGDPSGLFILVPFHRPWFLTDLENGTYYTRVVVEGTSNRTITLDQLPYTIEQIVD